MPHPLLRQLRPFRLHNLKATPARCIHPTHVIHNSLRQYPPLASKPLPNRLCIPNSEPLNHHKQHAASLPNRSEQQAQLPVPHLAPSTAVSHLDVTKPARFCWFITATHLESAPAQTRGPQFAPPTGGLSPLDATFTKNRGRGPIIVNQISARRTSRYSFDPQRISRDDAKFARGENLDLGLHGRVAIIAAASKGLGRAVAEELAREGASVAICARTASELEQAAAQIQASTGREVFHQAVDVTNPDCRFSFFRRCRRPLRPSRYLCHQFRRSSVQTVCRYKPRRLARGR